MLEGTIEVAVNTELLDQIRPWMLGALAILISSGVLLFLSEAVKCYFSDAYWLKMGALLFALAFTFGTAPYRWTASRSRRSATSRSSR